MQCWAKIFRSGQLRHLPALLQCSFGDVMVGDGKGMSSGGVGGEIWALSGFGQELKQVGDAYSDFARFGVAPASLVVGEG